MLRKAVRKPVVLAALGISNSTFYDGIAKGKYPKGTKIDPAGRLVVWWEDEIESIQKAAVARQPVAA
jgi:predicted DNA-binding transcriptional regulator AlpA